MHYLFQADCGAGATEQAAVCLLRAVAFAPGSLAAEIKTEAGSAGVLAGHYVDGACFCVRVIARERHGSTFVS